MPNEYQLTITYFSKTSFNIENLQGLVEKSRISDKKAEFSNQQFLVVVQRR